MLSDLLFTILFCIIVAILLGFAVWHCRTISALRNKKIDRQAEVCLAEIVGKEYERSGSHVNCTIAVKLEDGTRILMDKKDVVFYESKKHHLDDRLLIVRDEQSKILAAFAEKDVQIHAKEDVRWMKRVLSQ